jgi:hypothetical protein
MTLKVGWRDIVGVKNRIRFEIASGRPESN